MIKLILSVRLFAVALLTFMSVDGMSQSIVLKFNPPKGVQYDCMFENVINQQISGQNVDMTMDIGISMALIAQEGNIRVLQAKYTYFGMEMSMQGNSLKVNTKEAAPPVEEVKNDPSKMMQFIIRKVVDQSFLIKINDTGNVVEVTGFDAILDSMTNSTARELSLPDGAKARLKANMGAQFNDASMMNMMKESFNVYPANPVKVGDSWVKHVVVKGPSSKNMVTTYTVEAIEGSLVKLKATSILNSITTTGEVQRNFNGEQTAAMAVDIKSGMVMSSSFDQHMKDEANDHYLTTKGKITATVKK